MVPGRSALPVYDASDLWPAELLACTLGHLALPSRRDPGSKNGRPDVERPSSSSEAIGGVGGLPGLDTHVCRCGGPGAGRHEGKLKREHAAASVTRFTPGQIFSVVDRPGGALLLGAGRPARPNAAPTSPRAPGPARQWAGFSFVENERRAPYSSVWDTPITWDWPGSPWCSL